MKHNLIYAGVRVKNASFSCNAALRGETIFCDIDICSRSEVNRYVW